MEARFAGPLVYWLGFIDAPDIDSLLNWASGGRSSSREVRGGDRLSGAIVHALADGKGAKVVKIGGRQRA